MILTVYEGLFPCNEINALNLKVKISAFYIAGDGVNING